MTVKVRVLPNNMNRCIVDSVHGRRLGKGWLFSINSNAKRPQVTGTGGGDVYLADADGNNDCVVSFPGKWDSVVSADKWNIAVVLIQRNIMYKKYKDCKLIRRMLCC